MRSWAASALFPWLALGCAAQARAPAASPAESVAPATAVARMPEAAAEASVPAAPTVSAPSLESTDDARRDVLASARELAASAGSCPVACRALGSMDRAAGRLCALASSSSDRRACADVKAKVVTGRGAVRAACTACPGGVVVDPDAPCPSP